MPAGVAEPRVTSRPLRVKDRKALEVDGVVAIRLARRGDPLHESAMITIDDATRPIFVVRMEGTLTDEGLVAHHEALDRAIAEHAAPFCLIFDVLTPGMTGAQRDLQIAWIKRFQAKHAAQNRGVAFVLASRVARGVVRGLHWAASPSYAYEVTGELDRAQAWCAKRISAR